MNSSSRDTSPLSDVHKLNSRTQKPPQEETLEKRLMKTALQAKRLKVTVGSLRLEVQELRAENAKLRSTLQLFAADDVYLADIKPWDDRPGPRLRSARNPGMSKSWRKGGSWNRFAQKTRDCRPWQKCTSDWLRV